jgi:hypothetical protein
MCRTARFIRFPTTYFTGSCWANAIAMATPIAHKGVVAGAKVVAMTMIDLLTRPELVDEAKRYFNDVQLKNNKILPLLADTDEPQIQINRGGQVRHLSRSARRKVSGSDEGAMSASLWFPSWGFSAPKTGREGKP